QTVKLRRRSNARLISSSKNESHGPSSRFFRRLLEVSTRGLGPRRDRPCSRVAMRPHARRTVRAREAAVAVRADALRIRVLDDQIVRLTMRSSKLTPKRYAW